MRIHEILTEKIDQAEADEVYLGLKASGDDLVALYFMTTRTSPLHTIDTAQRAAERMAQKKQREILAAKEKKEKKGQQGQQGQQGQRPAMRYEPPKEYSDAFRGNQYVTRARKELPPALRQYLPILDKGLITAMSSGFNAGKNLGNLLSG